jgi:hypothetical protein
MAPSATLNRSHLFAIFFFFSFNLAFLFAFHEIPAAQVLLFILFFLVWCSPGYLFAVFSNRENRRGPFFWLVSIVAGYHLSSLLVVFAVTMFSVSLWGIALFMASALLTAFLIFHNRIFGQVRKFRLSRAGIDLLSLTLILALSLIFIFLVIYPHMQAGKTSANGFQYHDLFSTVFFKHVSITGELARTIPPENPFFGGEKLNYYWLFYIFPSVAHSALNIPLQETLHLLTWAIALVGLFSILILIHAFSTRTSDLIMAVTPLLFAYSYDGALVLANLKQSEKPFSEFTSINIDAAGRTYFDLPEVIGVYRGFVFDPHHMFAICLMILSFLLFRRVLRNPSWIVGSSALFLLGGVAGHSAFVAYTGVLWIAIWLLIEVLKNNVKLLKDRKFLFVAGCILLFYTVFYFRFPGFYQMDKTRLDIGLLPQSSLFLLIDFGALLILGTLGLVLGIKKRDGRILPLAVLLLVGFCQLLFTYFPEWPHDLSMKTGHSISIALACLSAHFFSKQAAGTMRRRIAKLGFVFVIFPALPTLAMDWYNLQQPKDVQQNTLISKEDLAACEWVNENLPDNAVVQSFPFRDGYAFYSLIPTFAERRTALGDPMHSRIFQGSYESSTNRRRLINLLFLTESSEIAWLVGHDLGVEYIYTGPTERKLFLDKQAKFRDTKHFEKIYANRLVRIFKLNPRLDVQMDSYDEKRDQSIVNIRFDSSFNQLWNENIWKPVEWAGISGAGLFLNTQHEFSGVLIFRIRSTKRTRLEVHFGQHLQAIQIEPEWQWIELNDLKLSKGINNLQFIMPNSDHQRFLISDVFFFGR